jgi:hypothetical protein
MSDDVVLIGSGRDHSTLEKRRKAFHKPRTFYIGSLQIKPGLRLPVNLEFCKSHFRVISTKITEGNLLAQYKRDKHVTPQELEILCFGSEEARAEYDAAATSGTTPSELMNKDELFAELSGHPFVVAETNELGYLTAGLDAATMMKVSNSLTALGLDHWYAGGRVGFQGANATAAAEFFGWDVTATVVPPAPPAEADKPKAQETEEQRAEREAAEEASRKARDEALSTPELDVFSDDEQQQPPAAEESEATTSEMPEVATDKLEPEEEDVPVERETQTITADEVGDAAAVLGTPEAAPVEAPAAPAEEPAPEAPVAAEVGPLPEGFEKHGKQALMDYCRERKLLKSEGELPSNKDMIKRLNAWGK